MVWLAVRIVELELEGGLTQLVCSDGREVHLETAQLTMTSPRCLRRAVEAIAHVFAFISEIKSDLVSSCFKVTHVIDAASSNINLWLLDSCIVDHPQYLSEINVPTRNFRLYLCVTYFPYRFGHVVGSETPVVGPLFFDRLLFLHQVVVIVMVSMPGIDCGPKLARLLPGLGKRKLKSSLGVVVRYYLMRCCKVSLVLVVLLGQLESADPVTTYRGVKLAVVHYAIVHFPDVGAGVQSF